ncbi:putative LPS assembly protein LptD [Chitinophaga rhizophila]|uniref:LPS-assembly protein LptD n=1 Tax=Chitinophaga rhizophila TaxID=2866212 RepID=A0ABS7GAX0_9BACT|nr:putative LPS assembly protein LptD [Chitinophaga rhizophila]MBW8684818.1 LPS-assembly protein LptD [Chitinophaga rhizophila]
MHLNHKNNYKKFLRQIYLTFAGILIVIPFIINAVATPAPNAGVRFNKSFTDTVPTDTTRRPGDTSVIPAVKDIPVPSLQPELPDSLPESPDLTGTDTMYVPKVSKDSIEAPITYKAKDSIVLLVPDKRFYFYGTANTKYQKTTLNAERMNYNQATGVMEATTATDTAGKAYGRPQLDDNGQAFDSDTLRVNIATHRAKIYNTRSQYGEGYVLSKQTKREADNSIFGYKNGYTTCNLDTPHFQFNARKIKVVPDKLVISGPANLEIEGVPTPLFIPFAIFPITHGQQSGILVPSYIVNAQKGMGLQNGGYYVGLGENFDMTLRGEIYSYGSWMLTASPTYRKRYRYNGGLTLSFSNTRLGDPSVKSEFNRSRDFRVNWNHSMDSKARPGITFGANVSFGTSRFNTFNLYDYASRVNNNLTSSINFSKTWQGKPFNFTSSLSHNQNLSTRDVSISFPSATFTMNTIYPFQPKEMVGRAKWYHKLGIGYNGSLNNSVTFKDSVFGKAAMFDALQSGVKHSLPIAFSIPVFNNFTLSPGVSYSEFWYTKKTIREWRPNKRVSLDSLGGIDTTYQSGFFAARQASASISLATAVYGMYQFGKTSKVKAIRHVMRPTISASYTPDLARNAYYYLQYNRAGDSTRQSFFTSSSVGVPTDGRSGAISFQLDNNLEMKVFSKKDTSANKEKKIKLLDGFGINGSYNMLADSFKLSPFQIYARTNLFDKLNITASGNIDPYEVNARGKRVDNYVWNTGKLSLGRLTSATVALQTSFQSSDKKSKDKQQQLSELENEQSNDAAFQAQQRQLEQVRRNPGEYVDFDIPWKLDLSYSLSYSNTVLPDSGGTVKTFTQYLAFNGDFSLTPKWKVGVTSGYNFIENKLAYTNMYISRDLHCWQMSINLVPIGTYRQFSITISPKSGILRDLRINRSRTFYDL